MNVKDNKLSRYIQVFCLIINQIQVISAINDKIGYISVMKHVKNTSIKRFTTES